MSSWNGKWPEEKARRAGRDILDAVDRGFEVKDVLGSILNVVGGVVSAMLSGAIIATENHKAW